MKIVRFASGLGNVMFQYALYLQVCKMYPDEDIYVDTVFYRFTGYPFEFNKIFDIDLKNDFYTFYTKKYNIDLEEKLKELNFWEKYGMGYIQFSVKYPSESAELNFEELPELYKDKYPNLRIISDLPMSISKVEQYIKEGDKLLSRKRQLRHRLEKMLSVDHAVLLCFILALYSKNGRKRMIKQICHFRKPDFCSFVDLSRISYSEDAYFNLYGNAMDCEGVREQIIEAFSFPELDEKNRRIYKEIANSNAVAIHTRVRHFQYGMGTILKRNYYKKAIAYIKRKSKEKLKYFIFSDDINWCKENILELGLHRGDDIVWVEGNIGGDAYKDMQLMSYCKYHIIPNSTFGWWGGYLSQREGKMMVTPYGTLPGTVSF